MLHGKGSLEVDVHQSPVKIHPKGSVLIPYAKKLLDVFRFAMASLSPSLKVSFKVAPLHFPYIGLMYDNRSGHNLLCNLPLLDNFALVSFLDPATRAYLLAHPRPSGTHFAHSSPCCNAIEGTGENPCIPNMS